MYEMKILETSRLIICPFIYDNAASIKVMQNLGMDLMKNPHSSPVWLQVVGVLNNPFSLDS
ncbi:MAG TPA: hypothetical protein VGP47_09210 [Parachlamydiaceae bacterium]|nr:hypothetical protein [Parachlamydiaceae bacterium]